MTEELTTAKAADCRGVDVRTIRSWIYNANNPLPAHKSGRDWFINKSDLEAYQPNHPGNPHKTKR